MTVKVSLISVSELRERASVPLDAGMAFVVSAEGADESPEAINVAVYRALLNEIEPPGSGREAGKLT
jgi:hypothetical protein